MITAKRKFSGHTPTWCPGCGDWAIGGAIKEAFVNLELDPSTVGVVFGIGCSGNMNDFLNAYAYHSLHGRAISTAVGLKLANHNMPTIVIAGDGDTYGEGGNHFLHACRGNHDITIVVHDNGVYGLTTGQVAPTATKGTISKSTPTGIIERSVSPLAFAISQGATFVAQSFAGDIPHMRKMIELGIKHKGLSLVNVLQPCVTFNRVNTYQYYLKNSYKVEDNYDPTSYSGALMKAIEMDEEKFPLGVIYQTESKPYHEQVPAYQQDKPLIQIPRISTLHDLIEEFR